MGDRISISFVNGDDESIALFSHWKGKDLLNSVKEYLKEIGKSTKSFLPFDRREPNTVMVDFVRWITKDMKRVDCDLYFGKNRSDGDNSDNGHFAIDLKTGEYK